MRSGHHAVIRWVHAHFPTPRYELNDAVAFSSSGPYRPHDWYETHRPPDCDTNLATLNFEDVDLSRCQRERLVDLSTIGTIDDFRTVLVLRDPFNLIASKIVLMRTREFWKENELLSQQTVADVVRLWKVMAREFAGETSFCACDPVRVSFNHWFGSRGYRDEIAVQLGFTNTDASINDVCDKGGGSSFDYQELNGRAQQMAVMDRWQKMQHDEEYAWVLQDRELFDLAERTTGIPDSLREIA